jgi:hypothetical protein
MDLHYRRSVLVRRTEDGRLLGTAKITNSPRELRADRPGREVARWSSRLCTQTGWPVTPINSVTLSDKERPRRMRAGPPFWRWIRFITARGIAIPIWRFCGNPRSD